MRKDKNKYNGLTKDSNKILSIDQAAKLLNVCTKTIHKHISTKREPGKIFAKKFGRLWRIQEKDIYRYLDEENG